jgi:hypothetical protein
MLFPAVTIHRHQYIGEWFASSPHRILTRHSLLKETYDDEDNEL